MTFKVGDKVRRKPEYQNVTAWSFGDKVLKVDRVTKHGDLTLSGDDWNYWNPNRFDLVELTLDEQIEEARAKLADLERQKREAMAPKPGETWIAQYDKYNKTVTAVILEVFQDFVIYRAMHSGRFQFASSGTLTAFLKRFRKE